MSFDMSQFLDVFYEESFEGLELMETELLDMDITDIDEETINGIFRAAHSIKGGSGTFGLNDVAEFTHVMETLLDQVRAGQKQMTEEIRECLLHSVDVLRDMLESNKDDSEYDQKQVEENQQQLQKLLDSDGSEQDDAVEQAQSEKDTSASVAEKADKKADQNHFHITFKPFRNLFFTGNDPLRLIRELEDLGTLKKHYTLDQLPTVEAFDPQKCFSQWDFELTTQSTLEDVKEVFSWVEDDCELVIETIDEKNTNNQTAEKAEESKPPKAVAKKAVKADKAKKTSTKSKNKKSKEQGSIRVNIDKIDELINLVGELVITQSMLGEIGKEFDEPRFEALHDGLMQLSRNTREIQESVLKIRMLPISFSFNRFPRMVHDTSTKLGKKVELVMTGENTEIDKTVMEKIGDPLVHLVRNSIDHGLELPEERIKAGKPEVGTVQLNAYQRGGNIVIEIVDDGAGINRARLMEKAIENGIYNEGDTPDDQEILNLIFHAGLSTAKELSDLSGRGVGMDVVRSNIHEIGGSIEISSVEGEGTTVRIYIPLTLAILDGQNVTVGKETYIIPLVSIIESIQIKKESINLIAGMGETFKLRDEYLPVIRIHQLFGIKEGHQTELDKGLMVVVEGERKKYGLFVDDLSSQQQVVIKSLEANYQKVDGISGATILGDGSVALILDIPGLIRLSHSKGNINYSYKKTA